MWAKDRDIAVIDPAAFREFAWAGQAICKGTGTSDSGVFVASPAPTPDFTSTSIEEGHIVNVGGVLFEVLSVADVNKLGVNVVRSAFWGPVEPGVPTGPAPFVVTSFRQQLDIVHQQVLGMLGLRAASAAGDELSEAAVVNGHDLARLEVLGALHLIYSGAGALERTDGPANQRAAMYRRRFSDERARVVAKLDTDGDGVADVVRRLNVLQWSRA